MAWWCEGKRVLLVESSGERQTIAKFFEAQKRPIVFENGRWSRNENLTLAITVMIAPAETLRSGRMLPLARDLNPNTLAQKFKDTR
jgi:hypothetical protein